MMNLSSFKMFLEEEPSRPPEKADYISSLGDEEGMEWNDIVKALEAEPWISSHFGIGSPHKEILYKLSPWKIVKGSLTPNGADIQLKPQKRNRSYLKHNRLNKSSYVDRRRYHLSRGELIKFLTTGWTPAVQAAAPAGGGDESMPTMS
jgi:hypothetical protein